MENFKRILIPTDGSEYSHTAIEKGISLAKLVNAEVTAIYVVDQTAFAAVPPDSLVTDLYTILKKEAEAAVGKVKDIGEREGVKVTTQIVDGSPAEEIVNAAEEHDIIVMATLGHTGLAKLLLGSVAEKVVRHAPCPVMLIRMTEK